MTLGNDKRRLGDPVGGQGALGNTSRSREEIEELIDKLTEEEEPEGREERLRQLVRDREKQDE